MVHCPYPTFVNYYGVYENTRRPYTFQGEPSNPQERKLSYRWEGVTSCPEGTKRRTCGVTSGHQLRSLSSVLAGTLPSCRWKIDMYTLFTNCGTVTPTALSLSETIRLELIRIKRVIHNSSFTDNISHYEMRFPKCFACEPERKRQTT